MEKNVSSEKVLDESFSKKEVSFCEKSSLLFYAAEEAVDTLNDSLIHTINSDHFPLSPEFSSMLQNSSMDSHAEYALPEAVVVLEKLPEALLHNHTYLNSVTECCMMPNVPQNIDKACSLKCSSSQYKKNIEPAMNHTNLVLKKNKYPLRNLKVTIPQLSLKENVSETPFSVDAYSKNSSSKTSEMSKIVKIKSRKASRNLSAQPLDQNLDSIQQLSLQNDFSKLPSSKDIETYEFLGKNNTEEKKCIKLVGSDALSCTASQGNYSEVSFDKYPCVHLEKINLESYLYGISNSSDCIQSKTDVLMDLELEVVNAMKVLSLSKTEKTLPLNEEVSLKTVNLSSPVIDVEENSTSSNGTSPEKNYHKRNMHKDLLIDNLDEVSSDNSVLFDHENSPSDISYLQNENIMKNMNCNNSILFKNAQNKNPVVLLERLSLPLSKTDTNYNMNSAESICTNSVPTVTDESDLPILIKNVCSISRAHFNKIKNHKKKSSKDSFNMIQKHGKKSSNQSFIDQSNESELSPIKPKSKYASSFNISESSSENAISDNSIYSSDNSLSGNEFPLIMFSKQKLNISQPFHHSEDSLSGDTSLLNLKSYKSPILETKTKNSHVKSPKHKKKKSKHGNASLVSLAKTNASLTSASKSKNSHIKSHNCKKKNFIHGHSDMHVSNKVKKNCNTARLPLEKKKSRKKSLRKKQMKLYKMITKYLKMQIKSKKHKKKSKKHKNLQGNSKTVESVKLISSNNESDTESTLSSDSVRLVYESVGRDHSYAQKRDKTSDQCKKVRHSESSILKKGQKRKYAESKNSLNKKVKTTAKNACHGESSSASKKDTKSKKSQNSIDKYRLGFLSNKFPLRFYNRFLASERLLLSNCKLKKNKKKEVKRLFSRLKEVGLMSLK